MKFIISHLKVAFEITGKIQRTEIFEYPVSALRELLLNAVVHRDYTSPVDIQIKIFDNAITFFNPGMLYGGLTVEELKTDSYQSRARNKLIAEAFYLTHDVEKYGSGYLRVRKEVADYPTMTFEYRESGDGYLVRLEYSEQRVESQPRVGERVGEKLTDNQSLILDLMQKNASISAGQIAKEIGISMRKTEENIKKLREKGWLERVGSARGGHWKVQTSNR